MPEQQSNSPSAPKRLNLGASDDHKAGFECADLTRPSCAACDAAYGGGTAADLRQPWPWPGSSADEIYAKDVAEHIGSGYRLKKTWRCLYCDRLSDFLHAVHCPRLMGDNSICGGAVVLSDVELIPYNGIIHFLNEAHRVLKPGGRMELIVPCYPGIAVWCDPTHASVWTSDTRYYFDERWAGRDGERGRLGPGMGITATFRTVGGRSGADWTPIQYAADAPDRRKLFLVLEAVK